VLYHPPLSILVKFLSPPYPGQLCSNHPLHHPSNDLEPSPDDIAITKKIIRAAEIVGIQVHEHLIISMEDDRYYSFADQGIIARMYAELG
jgi:hypothetical protein